VLALRYFTYILSFHFLVHLKTGWAGGATIITFVTASAIYTAFLLVSIQEPHHGTYSEVANDAMGREGFANVWVRPFQYLNFFPTVAVMILIGGQAMSTMDEMSNGSDEQVLSERMWTVVMGGLVMSLSLLPDLHHVWQVSMLGSLSVFLITFYCIAGSSMAIRREQLSPDYSQPNTDPTEYAFSVMTSFGDILFGFGFHTVLPDISASLHDSSSKDAHRDTRKAITAAFTFSYPAYILVALLGYAAFGAQVSSNVLLDITMVLSFSSMYIVWAFVVIKTATEATVYNQAAFTLLRDTFGLAAKNNIDHHPKNKLLDILVRFVWVAGALM